MTIVVDCSAVLALVLGESMAARVAACLPENETLIAPSLIRLEIANGLRTVGRRDHLDLARMVALGNAADRLPIDTVEVTASAAASLRDALSFGLTAYDAAYLRLAIDRDAALVTLDRALLSAAAAAGVSVIDP